MQVTIPKPKHPNGTKFTKRGKANVGRVYTVVDCQVTFNQSGAVVQQRYIATTNYLGQKLTDSDVLQTTIDMGVIE